MLGYPFVLPSLRLRHNANDGVAIAIATTAQIKTLFFLCSLHQENLVKR